MRARRHLFGPLASRRLGRSLGIDLTPGKVCSFDCVYCQLGRTRNRTLVRRAWVPLREVLAELDDWFERDGRADFVTLSGSGEPTLHPGFGDVIRHAGTASVVPVALLTNGSLLWDPEVRRGAAAADLVKVTFSSWDQSSYERIHRADPGLRFEEVLEGQRMLSRPEFPFNSLKLLLAFWIVFEQRLQVLLDRHRRLNRGRFLLRGPLASRHGRRKNRDKKQPAQ